jgi:hypothetical protein
MQAASIRTSDTDGPAGRHLARKLNAGVCGPVNQAGTPTRTIPGASAAAIRLIDDCCHLPSS